MRKWLSLLLCALLLTGCTYTRTKPEGTPYELFFREADFSQAQGGDALRTETVYYAGEEPADTETLARWLMEALLSGPGDESLKSVIPVGTALLSLETEGGRATVDLSAPYSTLSGVTLSMADYSITLTLTQLPDIRTVRITVRGQDLAYREKQSFTARDVLLASTEDVLGTMEADLYCLDGDGQLTFETRTLDLYEGDTQVGVVVEALQAGPENRDLQTALPEAFQVRSVWLEENTCYVNLASSALPDLPRGGPIQTALEAIAWSLCSLDTVDEVQFLVDGEFTGTYGSVVVAAPFVP